MTDQKHTPGPWDVERAPQNEGYDRAYVIERNPLPYSPQQGRRLAIVHGRSMENAEANARRIVACVNACEGLEFPENVHPLHRTATELATFHAEVMAGCDIQKGDRLYRQTEVIKPTGKTRTELQRDELLTLLEQAAATIELLAQQSPYGVSMGVSKTHDACRAAIAKATQGAGNVKGGA